MFVNQSFVPIGPFLLRESGREELKMASSFPFYRVNREFQVIEKPTSKNKIKIVKDLKTGNARQLL